MKGQPPKQLVSLAIHLKSPPLLKSTPCQNHRQQHYSDLEVLLFSCVAASKVEYSLIYFQASLQFFWREAFCVHREGCSIFGHTETRVGFFGRKKGYRGNPYGYIPVSECKAWAAELEEKMLRLGHITEEDLEGAKPDWIGDFLKWESKWRKEKNRDE